MVCVKDAKENTLNICSFNLGLLQHGHFNPLSNNNHDRNHLSQSKYFAVFFGERMRIFICLFPYEQFAKKSEPI